MGVVFLFHLLRKLLGRRVSLRYTGDEFIVKLGNVSELKWIASLLKYHSEFQMDQLMDVFGLDFPGRTNRFELQYVFRSSLFKESVRLLVPIKEQEAVPSMSILYSSANWLEREVWDMFGIFFEEHPDLRRILTDYGFDGFPLRKDFPVAGFLEVRYNESEKRIVYEPVELNQEYRLFHFLSPWEKK